MGIRGELFSTRVSCEGRTYFFNVKENRMGDLFLTVVESKPGEGENFDRRSIVLFKDDLPRFLEAFQGALGFLANPGDAAKGAASLAGLGLSGAGARAPKAAKPRAAKLPAGFAGSEAPAKRKVVVRRKAAEAPAAAAKPEPADDAAGTDAGTAQE